MPAITDQDGNVAQVENGALLVTATNPAAAGSASEGTLEEVRDEIINVQDHLPLEVFNSLVVSSRRNQLEVSFFESDPDSNTDVTCTKSAGGDNSLHEGHAHFNTSANVNGKSSVESVLSVTYRPMHEIFAAFTATWTAPTSANSYQRIGLYDANNGFFVGYNGLTFGIGHRKAAVDAHVPRASWNGDLLTGAVGSKFTRGGVPEAIDLTKVNIFRIRFGWLGSAPVTFEVLSPDGEWVTFHTIVFPNLSDHPSVADPNLPMRLHVSKTGADATDLVMTTGCWAAGTSAEEVALVDTLTDKSLAQLVRAVLVAKKPNGDYVNISANAQGRLLLSVTADDFTRILKFEPIVGEEIRRDETLTDDYHGVAPDGSLTSAAVWSVARFYKTAGLITRVRYRTGVVWDNRTAGW